MKRLDKKIVALTGLFAVVLIAVVAMLTSGNDGAYERGYADARKEAYREGYDDGYDKGYREGIMQEYESNNIDMSSDDVIDYTYSYFYYMLDNATISHEGNTYTIDFLGVQTFKSHMSEDDSERWTEWNVSIDYNELKDYMDMHERVYGQYR